jgi:4-hydroxybenzoyl-CoA thioesterase
MVAAKLTLPKGRERPYPIHPRDYPDDAWSATRMARFSDCDAAGNVYTPSFINMVHGVIEDFFLQQLCIDYHGMFLKEHIGLGYKSVDTDFFRPALMGDRLQFTVLVEHVGRTSVIFSVHCVREIEEIMRCRLVMVTTSLSTRNAINIPPTLKEALSAYKEMCG